MVEFVKERKPSISRLLAALVRYPDPIVSARVVHAHSRACPILHSVRSGGNFAADVPRREQVDMSERGRVLAEFLLLQHRRVMHFCKGDALVSAYLRIKAEADNSAESRTAHLWLFGMIGFCSRASQDSRKCHWKPIA